MRRQLALFKLGIQSTSNTKNELPFHTWVSILLRLIIVSRDRAFMAEALSFSNLRAYVLVNLLKLNITDQIHGLRPGLAMSIVSQLGFRQRFMMWILSSGILS